MATQDVLNPLTATSTACRTANPWWNIYSIYALTGTVISLATSTTAANYMTCQFLTGDGGSTANLGSSFTTQNDTQNARVGHSVTMNSVVSSTVENFELSATETGATTSFLMVSLTYRLVG
jgi:hypothetical protein